jgi:hypothetical protein
MCEYFDMSLVNPAAANCTSLREGSVPLRIDSRALENPAKYR